MTKISVTSEYNGIISNGSKIDECKIKTAQKIIFDMQNELKSKITEGYGPFMAAVYDSDGNFVAKSANTVIKDNCCCNHAEINVINLAQKKYKNYDLSKYDLSIYITAEPCMMCMGAIIWSGIKTVYYSVPSVDVEKITGYDEGFKPDWFNEFAKRGIEVYGNIEAECGKDLLKYYVETGCTIYKPER